MATPSISTLVRGWCNSCCMVSLLWLLCGFQIKYVRSMASFQRLRPASSHILTVSLIKNRSEPQQWSFHRLSLRKQKWAGLHSWTLALLYLPGSCGCLGSDALTDKLIRVRKECFLTLSHYSPHFKAVLGAGRKWDGSLEHKTGFGEGVAHENTDVI